MADTRRINLSRIPRERRGHIWQRLQELHPAVAELLQSEHVQQVRSHKKFKIQVILELQADDPLLREI